MIIIAPYAARMPSGRENPKNYPFWRDIIHHLNLLGHEVVQVGVTGEVELVKDCRFNLSAPDLRQLIKKCDAWISCDSFFQHFGWDEQKRGIVLWSVSDPLIYGHPENINLLKSRDNLVENQFLWWDNVKHDPHKFVAPELVIEALISLLDEIKSAKTNKA